MITTPFEAGMYINGSDSTRHIALDTNQKFHANIKFLV